MGKRLSLILLTIAVAVLAKFWIGVYAHDEFPEEKHIFIKHRAIWKTYFYSPRGMGERKLSDLTSENKTEQELFDEFVIENQYSK